jgi:uncharacterized surface protein with fasciclin (FAS1) repeats
MSNPSIPSLAAALAAALIAVAPLPAAAQSAKAPAPTTDIVQTAVAAGSFTTLARLLETAGLVQTLKGPGPFTVFAPTDAAFAKLPKATVDALVADTARLKQVLTYHVVPGRVTASQVSRLTSAKTVNGQSVRIRAMNGKVMVDDATVAKADVMATNGVIHVIDSVILPQ